MIKNKGYSSYARSTEPFLQGVFNDLFSSDGGQRVAEHVVCKHLADYEIVLVVTCATLLGIDDAALNQKLTCTPNES